MSERTIHAINTPGDLQRLMREPHPVSDEQWPAVSGPLEPAVVVAGAGSGKTSLMKARVVYLVATGQVLPHEVLGLTFTTKAAGELRVRVREALEAAGLLADAEGDEERLEPTVATYNSYASSLLTEHGLRIGHEPDTRLLADATRFQLAGRVVARHQHDVRWLTESPRHVITYLLGLEGALSEHLRTTDEVRAWQAEERELLQAALATERAKKDLQGVLDKLDEREELLQLVDEYRVLKQRLGVMDFSDQIALAARLAEEFAEVGKEERAKFKVVLLDEYQDTSVAQARLLGALFSGRDAQSGLGHPVTAVGDPYQAIYGWRGASASNILRIAATFPSPQGASRIPEHSLTVSWRCDQRILSVANRIAGPLADAVSGAPVVDELRPSPIAGAGHVEATRHESQAHELDWLPEQVEKAVVEIRSRRGLDQGGYGQVGVLTRDNATAALVFDALSAADIPVEIVGLAGLLRLPEVAEVVATLTLLHDLNANAELLTLLSGPRWAIGPRDLALLGRRARELAGGVTSSRDREPDLHAELQAAVGGADPTELLSLSDALDDPGDLPYSHSARERFGLLAAELRMLRRRTSEPLLDLVRLIIDTCGIDLELASSTSRSAAARRDNLDLFVKAVADFQSLDSDSSLGSLLAYLTAEDEFGAGLDIATPTASDSVKLLTVHRAKGLEWDAVFVVGVADKKFPSGVSRSTWLTSSGVLPSPLRGDHADIPQLQVRSRTGIADYKVAVREHDLLEERRLAYVAFTRARHHLSVSAHWRLYRGSMIAGSDFHTEVADAAAGWGDQAGPWAPEPDPEQAAAPPAPVPWPVTERSAEALRRLEAADRFAAVTAADEDPELDITEAATVQQWDVAIDRLVAEAAAQASDVVEVPLPSSLSATSLARLRDDPEGFARDLARPMPRPPAPQARFGTRFHEWVEARFGQQTLLDVDEIPGRADLGIDDADDLREVIARFEAGEFAERVPHAVEAPFALVLAGQVVRGRIDAVYAEPDGTWLVVDWKTNQRESADPLQLAIYRVAWAELAGVDVDRVRAAFHYVRSGATVSPPGLPERAELEALLQPGGDPLSP